MARREPRRRRSAPAGAAPSDGWSRTAPRASATAAAAAATGGGGAAAALDEQRRQRRGRRPPPLMLLVLALALAAVATTTTTTLLLAAAARPSPSTRNPTSSTTTKGKPAAGYGSPDCAELDTELDKQDLSGAGPGVEGGARCGAQCRAEITAALVRLYDLWQGDGWELGTAAVRAANAEEEDAEGGEEERGTDLLRLNNDRPWAVERDYCQSSALPEHSCHVSPPLSALMRRGGGAEENEGEEDAGSLSSAPLRLTVEEYERNPIQPEYCCWSGVVCCMDYGSADGTALASGGNGTLLLGNGGAKNPATPCMPYTVKALVMRGFGANGSLADAVERDGADSPLRVLYRYGLRTLRLSSNDLRGPIPKSIGAMPLLRTLDLADNWLNGELPSALGSMPGLVDVALDFNLLEGPLSRAAFCDTARTGRSRADLATLQALTARANALTGSIDLRPCAGLRLVDLRDNRLSGTVPFGVENQALTTVRLSNNALSGRVPEDVWFVQFLNVLDLANNSLTGSISPAVADAGHLNTLYLARNRLRGLIPKELFLAPQLSLLDLMFNPGLNGTLPWDMSNAVGLTRLLLRGTGVSGAIPPSMGELPFLTDVDMRATEMSCCRSWDEALRANRTTQQRLDAAARGEAVEPPPAPPDDQDSADMRYRGEPELLPYFLTFSGEAIVSPGSQVFTSAPGVAAQDGSYPAGGVGAAGVRSVVQGAVSESRAPRAPPAPPPPSPPLASRPPKRRRRRGLLQQEQEEEEGEEWGKGKSGGQRRRQKRQQRHLLATRSSSADKAPVSTTIKGNYVSDPSVQVDVVLGNDAVCPSVKRASGSNAAGHRSGGDATRDGRAIVLSPTDLSSQSWLLDPAYYWDLRCRCQAGLVPKREQFEYTVDGMGAPLRYDRLTCVQQQASADREVALAIGLSVGLAGAVIFACLFAWCMCFRRVSRTQRALAAASKRLKGCPRSGAATFVVTDIEGYSDLMKSCPDAMLRALSLHNAVLRRAKYSNVGYTLEQEGDSFALLFHTPYDAVSFCLQAQQALMRVEWPRSLLAALDERMAEEAEGALREAGMVVEEDEEQEEEEEEVVGGDGKATSEGPPPPPQPGALSAALAKADGHPPNVCSNSKNNSASSAGGAGWLGEPPTSSGLRLASEADAARRRPSSFLWGGGRSKARPVVGGGSNHDDDDEGEARVGDCDAATERTASTSTPRDLSPVREGGKKIGGRGSRRWGARGAGGGAGSAGARGTPSGARTGSTLFARLASSPSIGWIGGGRRGSTLPAAGSLGTLARTPSDGANSGSGGNSGGLSGGDGSAPRARSGGLVPARTALDRAHHTVPNVASPLLSSVTGPFRGLRVRMGIATGPLPGHGQDPRAAAVFQMAKAVCDSASGGQVLMDARTFAGVKEDLHALGATDAGGLNYRRLASKRSVRDALCCAPAQESDEAVVLDMGAYVVRPWSRAEGPYRGKPPAAGGSAPLAAVAEAADNNVGGGEGGGGKAPATTQQQHVSAFDGGPLLPGAMDAFDPASADGAAEGGGGGGGGGGLGGLVTRQLSMPGLSAWTRPTFVLRGGGGGGGGAGDGANPAANTAAPPAAPQAGGGTGGGAANANAAWAASDPIVGALASQQRLRAEDVVRLVQILAPPLVGRAKVFGNVLALPPAWVCVDPPYFTAPAAGELPLAPEGRREADAAAALAALEARAGGSGGASAAGGSGGSGGVRGSSLSVILSGGGASGAGVSGGVVSGGRAGNSGGIAGAASAPPLSPAVMRGGGRRGQHAAFAPSFVAGGGGAGGAGGSGAPLTAASSAPIGRSAIWRSVALGPSGGGVFAALSGAHSGGRSSAATAIIRAQQAAAAGALLSPSLLPVSAPAPPITMVFVCVEGAKALVSKRRRAYAREMHALILGLAAAALAHVAPVPDEEGGGKGGHADENEDDDDNIAFAAPRGAGYLCREQEGELKYMVAFSTPRAALEWCLVVQEAAMYLRWPRWVLQSKGFHAHYGPAMAAVAAAAAGEGVAAVAAAAQLAAEAMARHGGGSGPLPRGPAGLASPTPPVAATPPSPLPFGAGGARALLFRGPRLKMGVCEGVPSTVLPDHLGRADYHGASVNQAARYMDAGAHGGQVVCEAELARRVFDEWRREAQALERLAAQAQEAEDVVDGPAYVQVGGGAGAAQTDSEEEGEGGAAAAAAAAPAAAAAAGGGDGAASSPFSASHSPTKRGASRLSNMQPGVGADPAAETQPQEPQPQPQPPCARPEPPGPRLAPPSGASRRPVRVEAHWAGKFRFKGNPQPVDLVCVTQAALAGRLALLPPDPPKGKGVRLGERCGVAFSADSAMLPALPQMYRARVPQHVLEPPPGALGRGRGGMGTPQRSGSSVSSLMGGMAGPPPAAIGGSGGAFSAGFGGGGGGSGVAASAGAMFGGGGHRSGSSQAPSSLAHLRVASLPPSLASVPRSGSAARRGVPSFLHRREGGVGGGGAASP